MSEPELDEAAAKARLAALGFAPADVEVLAAHFFDAERRGRTGHGLRRIDWLESWPELETSARPVRVVSEPGYERWDGKGALGYITLDAIVKAQLAEPPETARVISGGRTFPTGMLGHFTRRLAEGGLVSILVATSPRRLGHPDGGEKLTGTNPISIGIPSSDGKPIVVDVSMGNHTFGDVLAGRVSEDDLAPFGGALAHKAFALAVGVQLVVDALTVDDGFGAVLVVARPQADPVPALRTLAAGMRLPGDGG